MKSLYRLPMAAALLLLTLLGASWAWAKSDWDDKARSRKAEYIFLESQSAYSTGKYDEYITLLERAYALDSSDVDIAGEWAVLNFLDQNVDSATYEKSYQLIKRQYLANPRNYTSGLILSSAAQRSGHYEDAVMVWEMLDSIYPRRTDIPFQLADAYANVFATGDTAALDKAMAIYDRIESGSGRSIDLTSKKLEIYNLKQDTAAVISELDSLYASAPQNTQIALYIGATYMYLDRPDKTIEFLNRACELDSTNGIAYLLRARFYHIQGDSAAYDREVFHALKSPNLEVSSKIEILRSYVAELYQDTTQETRLRQLFDDLQLMHSGEPEIHSLYGSYLYELEDFPGAAEQFSYMVALNPSDNDAWSSYVQMSIAAGDTIAAVNAATEAMHRFPTELYFPQVLSIVYRLNDELDKAIAVLDSVDVSKVKNARIVSNFLTSKGDLYSMAGDTIKSLEIYDEAIALNPDNSMALNNAAYFLTLTNGDLDKAERYSARSLKGDELNPTYLDTYAWVFFKKKDYKMAKTYIDIALKAYGVMPEGDEVPVPVSTDEGDEDTELPSADIYDHAGDIYFMNGEVDQALEFWKQAQALDPDDPIIEKKVTNKTIFFR